MTQHADRMSISTILTRHAIDPAVSYLLGLIGGAVVTISNDTMTFISGVLAIGAGGYGLYQWIKRQGGDEAMERVRKEQMEQRLDRMEGRLERMEKRVEDRLEDIAQHLKGNAEQE